MYAYDDIDRAIVHERVEEFRDQVSRRLSGELTEDEFKPLRLMNGVYLQLHAYMYPNSLGARVVFGSDRGASTVVCRCAANVGAI